MFKRHEEKEKLLLQPAAPRRRSLKTQLRHFEIEFVALIAVVFAFLMHQVAVRALERFAVMRRDVRIDGLHILRLFNQLINIVAARAGSHFRHLRVLHVRTVAGLALQALGDMLFGEFLAG